LRLNFGPFGPVRFLNSGTRDSRFGGMIAATVLAVFFVPVFYVIMQRLSEFRRRPAITMPAVHATIVEGEEVLAH
jgi:hypothetical protein